jgi:hypothetical protein
VRVARFWPACGSSGRYIDGVPSRLTRGDLVAEPSEKPCLANRILASCRDNSHKSVFCGRIAPPLRVVPWHEEWLVEVERWVAIPGRGRAVVVRIAWKKRAAPSRSSRSQSHQQCGNIAQYNHSGEVRGVARVECSPRGLLALLCSG